MELWLNCTTNLLFRTQLIIELCRPLQCKPRALKNNNNQHYSWLEKPEEWQNSDDTLLDFWTRPLQWGVALISWSSKLTLLRCSRTFCNSRFWLVCKLFRYHFVIIKDSWNKCFIMFRIFILKYGIKYFKYITFFNISLILCHLELIPLVFAGRVRTRKQSLHRPAWGGSGLRSGSWDLQVVLYTFQ